MPDLEQYKQDAERLAAQLRSIQQQVAEAEKARPKQEPESPVQTGARDYPGEFPAQHQPKPGSEADLELKPMFDAPYYKGSGKLEGFGAIVTGGDSGIGRSVAVLFAREGGDVAIVYLNEHEDAEATKTVIEREGRRAILIPGDVSDSGFCKAAVEATVAAFGRLDVLVNNAAFQVHVGQFEDLTDEHFDRTLKTNLYGYFNMAKAAVPHLKPKSAIVNCGSVTGILGNAGLLDYSMTKGGIHAFTRSLGTHLAAKGIRVNAVAPGPVWTPLNPSDRNADEVKTFGQQTVLKRAAQPEEIAPAFVFLASPQTASYITGEVLRIIGGYSGG